MMQIVESGDDYFEPRFSNGSMRCLFPPLAYIDSPRRSLYNKLQQHPLRLTILKLDGSSFGIEVSKNGTVGELKRAVEAAFDHLPKMGPGRVSWEHVWGQFCLCHEGQKLLSDKDYISLFGIRDGDQLQFVHHPSNACNFVKMQSKRQDHDVDDVPCVSHGYNDGHKTCEKDNGDHMEIIEENQEEYSKSDEIVVVSRREHRLTRLLKGWFPYQKLTSSRKRSLGERRSHSATISRDVLGSFKNCVRFSSNKYESQRITWK